MSEEKTEKANDDAENKSAGENSNGQKEHNGAAHPPTAPGKKKSKLGIILALLIGIIIVILLIVMTAQAIIITRLKVSVEKIEELRNQTQSLTHGSGAHDSSHQKGANVSELEPQKNGHGDPNANKIYMPLPNKITVNLVPDNAGNHFLQVDITLILKSESTKELIKQKLPEIQSQLILYLSAQKAHQLHSQEGKARLITIVKNIINKTIAPKSWALYQTIMSSKNGNIDNQSLQEMGISFPVEAVLFTSFFIQ